MHYQWPCSSCSHEQEAGRPHYEAAAHRRLCLCKSTKSNRCAWTTGSLVSLTARHD